MLLYIWVSGILKPGWHFKLFVTFGSSCAGFQVRQRTQTSGVWDWKSVSNQCFTCERLSANLSYQGHCSFKTDTSHFSTTIWFTTSYSFSIPELVQPLGHFLTHLQKGRRWTGGTRMDIEPVPPLPPPLAPVLTSRLEMIKKYFINTHVEPWSWFSRNLKENRKHGNSIIYRCFNSKTQSCSHREYCSWMAPIQSGVMKRYVGRLSLSFRYSICWSAVNKVVTLK